MECCRVDDTSPEDATDSLAAGRVDPDVASLYISINPLSQVVRGRSRCLLQSPPGGLNDTLIAPWFISTAVTKASTRRLNTHGHSKKIFLSDLVACVRDTSTRLPVSLLIEALFGHVARYDPRQDHHRATSAHFASTTRRRLEETSRALMYQLAEGD